MYGHLVNLMYMALSTSISNKFRKKEERRLSMSINFWNDHIESEFFKNDFICEGIDNVEKINKHFEKTLIEKHKAMYNYLH